MEPVTADNTNAKQPPVGIDLGTTYSLVAYIDPSGRPLTVLNGVGDMLTPSALMFEDGEVVVGKEASKSSVISPEVYAECFKRDMGHSNYHLRVRGHEVPPEVLSGFILQRLKADAEQRLGPIRKVVITVPAFFDERRRQATQKAGLLAGLDVLDIINEPTAAAVAFGYQQGVFDIHDKVTTTPSMRVLVYDLGGGTFDVTILEIDGGTFRTIATDGDVQLGGKDFDQRLVDYIAENFIAQHGIDPRSDLQDAAQLWLEAQDVKHALSERNRAKVVCHHAGLRSRAEVTRAQFESMTKDLLERTETTTALVMKQAHFGWGDIDQVLLVGGSSRMPMVVDMLRNISGKDLNRSMSPDEAVSHGAALYAAMLTERGNVNSRLSSCELINVNSHSLGVVGIDPKTGGKVNAVLIPKNSPLPCRAEKTLLTGKPGQRSVLVKVVEGESHRPEDCVQLGECVIRNLPPELPKGTKIQIEYRYASNGRISVSAKVKNIRHSAHIEIGHDDTNRLGDLNTWCALLNGQAVAEIAESRGSEETATYNADSRRQGLKHLDSLYSKIGKVAVGKNLPDSLIASQRQAKEASQQLAQARAAVKEAEKNVSLAQGGAETIRAESALAGVQNDLRQTQARFTFMFLVLGRECADNNCQIHGVETLLQEVKELRRLWIK